MSGHHPEQPLSDHGERTYQMKAENPYSAPTVIEAMHHRGYGVPFSRVFVAWLSFSLITVFVSVALCFAISVLLAAMWRVVGGDRNATMVFARSCCILVPIPVSLLCYWLSLLREEDWVTGTVKVWDARALVVEAVRTRSGRSVPGDPGVGSEEEMP